MLPAVRGADGKVRARGGRARRVDLGGSAQDDHGSRAPVRPALVLGLAVLPLGAGSTAEGLAGTASGGRRGCCDADADRVVRVAAGPVATAEPPVRDLYSVPVATMTRVNTGLGGSIVSGERPRPRGFARPEQLELPLDTLPGVAATLAKKLRPLGLETVGDLLLRRPRRYETAADEVAISELWGDEETVIAGVVRNVRQRWLRNRRSLVSATIADASGVDLGLVVQPAVGRGSPQARHRGAAARQARPLRLRRQVVRRGGDARDRGLRAGVRGERGTCRRGGCAS